LSVTGSDAVIRERRVAGAAIAARVVGEGGARRTASTDVALGAAAMSSDVVQIPFALFHQDEPPARIETIGVAVLQSPHDRAQLAPMAKAAREAMGMNKIQALADRGYFSGPQIKACSDEGIAAVLPKPKTSNAKADGRFDKSDFVYDANRDQYRCPAGQHAVFRMSSDELGQIVHRYWSSACPQCPMKSQCTPSDFRRISRWEHEAVVDAVQHRLDRQPDAMIVRRRTVEHVFGTLKHWMGSTHFLTRRLPNVRTEIGLHVLAYNLKRLIAILGFAGTMKAIGSMA